MKLFYSVLSVAFLLSSFDLFAKQAINNLKEQVVVLTGASGDIGQSIAFTLLENGFFVVLHYNSNEVPLKTLEQKYPEKCIAIKSNFNEYHSVIQFWKKAQNWKNHVDCVINCAGILNFVDITASDNEWCKRWESVLKINLIAPSLICKKACEHFLKRNCGIIINISSRTADNGYPLNGMHYAASKAGLKVLGKSIAVTYGRNNIYSYVISPGCVNTKMVKKIDETTLTSLKKEIPTDKFVEPQEIASLVLLICSGKIKSATGASFDLNGASYLR